MLQDVLRDMDLTIYPEIAMTIFLGVFVLVVIRVMQPGERPLMKRAARMPLHDGLDESLDDPHTEAR